MVLDALRLSTLRNGQITGEDGMLVNGAPLPYIMGKKKTPCAHLIPDLRAKNYSLLLLYNIFLILKYLTSFVC